MCEGGIESGVVAQAVIPATQDRGRRTVSSKPAWATLYEPVTKENVKERLGVIASSNVLFWHTRGLGFNPWVGKMMCKVA